MADRSTFVLFNLVELIVSLLLLAEVSLILPTTVSPTVATVIIRVHLVAVLMFVVALESLIIATAVSVYIVAIASELVAVA